jgi:Phage integrase family.
MTTEIKNVHLTDDSGNTLDPPMIYIPAPKGDVEPRWTCMTSEAADAVRAWLAVRTDYMTKGAVIAKRVVRVKNVANADSTRLFPFVPELMEQRFRKACTAAGVCKKSSETGHHIITVHSLRRYTDTRLYEIGMHSFGEKLLGHDSEDVRHLYSRLTPEQIAKEYKKVEHALLLNVSADKYEQVIMSEQQNTESIDTLRRQLDVQKAENENLKRSMDERIAHLEQQIAERDRDMRVFMQQVTKGMYRVVTNDDDRDLAKKMYEAAGRK